MITTLCPVLAEVQCLALKDGNQVGKAGNHLNRQLTG
jgi:hypothetical protein